MALEGKVAIITGGGRGIGRAIAEACAREGARVSITARTESQLQETADLIRANGGQVQMIVSDVTDKRDVSRALASVLDRWGRADLLVNNAGSFTAVGPVWDSEAEAWFQDIRTNLLGSHLWCAAVIPRMLEGGGGRIVNMIGGGTYGPFEYGSGYGSSKVALMRYTETLAVELTGRPITVFAVDPGLVRTQMVERIVEGKVSKHWFGWMAKDLAEGKDTPPTAAAAVVVEIASGRLDRLSGRAIYSSDDLVELERNTEGMLSRDWRTLRMVQ